MQSRRIYAQEVFVELLRKRKKGKAISATEQLNTAVAFQYLVGSLRQHVSQDEDGVWWST